MNPFTVFRKALAKYGLADFGRYYSRYMGTVHSNEDPSFQGRLQVKCPAVYGDQHMETWAYPCGMPSGNGMGFFSVPQKGDPVWVSFEEGDPQHPIWEYGPWAKAYAPEVARLNPPTNHVWQTPAGVRIELDDKNGLFRVTDKKGLVLELNGAGKISLGSKTESAEPGVLGNTLKTRLEELFQAIENAKVATMLGPQPVINLPEFLAVKQQLQSILSEVVTLD